MAKKSSVKQTMNMFEPVWTEAVQELSGDRSSVSIPKIADACPRCGGRSQETAHPMDHEGKTRYCYVCATEDGPFYFEPEKPREVETEAVGEGEQAALIETGEKWEEAWRGMPEFAQEDLAPWKSIYVHFESREDMERFAKLVKQKIGLNTRSIWYPEAEIGRMTTKRYVDSGTVDKRTKDDLLR